MRRGATSTLPIVVLLFVICLGFVVTATAPAHAEEQPILSDQITTIRVPGPAPLGGGNDNGGGNPPATLDSGDDDDYWDGVQGDNDPPMRSRGKTLMLIMLETWWHSGDWLWP